MLTTNCSSFARPCLQIVGLSILKVSTCVWYIIHWRLGWSSVFRIFFSQTPHYGFLLLRFMSFTICCVALRMVGLAGMTLVFGLGWFITAVFINSRIPPETTAIYYIFGFNHICNNVDHMPAREVAAVLTPLTACPLPYAASVDGSTTQQSDNQHTKEKKIFIWWWKLWASLKI